jgi:hypothetical protein
MKKAVLTATNKKAIRVLGIISISIHVSYKSFCAKILSKNHLESQRLNGQGGTARTAIGFQRPTIKFAHDPIRRATRKYQSARRITRSSARNGRGFSPHPASSPQRTIDQYQLGFAGAGHGCAGTKPLRFGIWTLGRLCWSMASVSLMMPFLKSRYAVTE